MLRWKVFCTIINGDSYIENEFSRLCRVVNISVSQSKSSEFVCKKQFQSHMSKGRTQIEPTHYQEYLSTSVGTIRRDFVCKIHQVLDLTSKIASKPATKRFL